MTTLVTLTIPFGVSEVEPPQPGYTLIENGLQLVNGQCIGSTTVRYTFLTIDTPWAVGFDISTDCAITPKIYDGPAETFAYRVGGAAGQTMFVDDTPDQQIHHGLAVSWPFVERARIGAHDDLEARVALVDERGHNALHVRHDVEELRHVALLEDEERDADRLHGTGVLRST